MKRERERERTLWKHSLQRNRTRCWPVVPAASLATLLRTAHISGQNATYKAEIEEATSRYKAHCVKKNTRFIKPKVWKAQIRIAGFLERSGQFCHALFVLRLCVCWRKGPSDGCTCNLWKYL